MSPEAVVIGLDIFKDLLFGLVSREKGCLVNEFCLDGFEKRLRNRIVPAVPFAAHAL